MRLRGRAGTKIAAGDGDAQAFAAAREQRRGRLHRTLRADRIVVIVTLHRVIGEREIARAARQRSDVIEACNEGKRVGAGKPAVGRLQAENPAERGRHADRAVGIGAERDRHEAAGDRAARAAGGAARHPADVVGIARGAVVDVLAGEVVGIFTHIERPHEHGAVGFLGNGVYLVHDKGKFPEGGATLGRHATLLRGPFLKDAQDAVAASRLLWATRYTSVFPAPLSASVGIQKPTRVMPCFWSKVLL